MNKKKLLLACLVMALIMVSVPASLGYGTGYNSAESKAPGIYNEHMDTGDTHCWYKLYLYEPAVIYVNIAFNYPTDLLYLTMTSNSNLTESSNDDAIQNVSMIVNVTSIFYWRMTDEHASGNVDFEMNVTVVGEWALNAPATTPPPIPGFELLPVLFMLGAMVSIVFLCKKRLLTSSNS